MPRTLASLPAGKTSTVSPTWTAPEIGMPVTIVPKPLALKTRCTGRRKMPASERGSVAAASL